MNAFALSNSCNNDSNSMRVVYRKPSKAKDTTSDAAINSSAFSESPSLLGVGLGKIFKGSFRISLHGRRAGSPVGGANLARK